MRLASLAIAALLAIAPALLVAAPSAGQSPIAMIELVCGRDLASAGMTGASNVTLSGGANVAAGALCEIRLASSQEVLDTFAMGVGWVMPLDGQFDYVSGFGGEVLDYPAEIFIRCYDAPDRANSTVWGDSSPITLASNTGTHYLPGWVLTETSAPPPDDGDGSGGDDGGSGGGDGDGGVDDGSSDDGGEEGGFWDSGVGGTAGDNVLYLAIAGGVALVAIVLLHFLRKGPRGPAGNEEKRGYPGTRKRANR